jgi:hypothetical protein
VDRAVEREAHRSHPLPGTDRVYPKTLDIVPVENGVAWEHLEGSEESRVE